MKMAGLSSTRTFSAKLALFYLFSKTLSHHYIPNFDGILMGLLGSLTFDESYIPENLFFLCARFLIKLLLLKICIFNLKSTESSGLAFQ